ncbi:hypothetical protein [Erythrobacter sp. HKB08]|uniref:PAS domain-containing protein n=1 Tax=Erythrobacter sp. HKB08 TaxID=2502843 RepID=UPI001008FA81
MDTLRGNFGSYDSADDERDWDSGEDETGREPPPAAIGSDERRMQVRAYNHWASLLEDRAFPSIEDLDPESLPDFGPYSVLLDFTAGIEDPAIQYLGETLAEECGTDVEISQLSDVPSRSLLSRITDHYMQILANQAPIGFEAEFVNQREATILYRGILLPYSSDGETIDFIYGVINWKEMADQMTTDELLLEIDQALDEAPVEDAPLPSAAEEDVGDDWADGPGSSFGADEISDIASPPSEEETDSAFPAPAFGVSAGDFAANDEEFAAEDDDDWAIVDPNEEPGDDLTEDGIPDDELAADDEDVVSRLSSLIQPRTNVTIDWDDEDEEEPTITAAPGSPLMQKKQALPPLEESDFETQDYAADEPVEQAVEEPAEETVEPFDLVEEFEEAPAVEDIAEDIFEDLAEEPVAEEVEFDANAFADDVAEEETPVVSIDETSDATGLYDCLAEARELAQAARNSEDRTRSALYAAVGRAYDVSLAAEEDPEEFAELVEENGLTVQDRAPMTPVVKLVFGADYDKTRLAEYATVLAHARRNDVGRGELAGYLASAEGGLKGVVQAERRLRREEQGKEVDPVDAVRPSLARQLRKIEGTGFDAIDPQGEEFGVVMIRRLTTGEIVVLGEVSDAVKLVEKVGREVLSRRED